MKRIATSLLLPILAIGFCFFNPLPEAANAQQNWPEFRGPTGDGHATDAKLPTELDSSKVSWELPIHGKGWSSPVIWDDQVWLTTATDDGKQQSVIGVDLESGEKLHDFVVFENEDPDFCHDTNSYASPTPAIETGRLYVHFGSYGTACLDTETAKIIWQRRDLPCDHFRGPASSPILYKNLLIVAFDGFDHQYVVALNKETGETVWKKDRDIKYGTDNGDYKKAYGTGAIFDVGGRPLLVYPSAVATIAYDPMTGKQAWTVYHDGMNASARPLITEDGLVIVSNGHGKLLAIKPEGKGNISETHVAWQSTKAIPRKSSPIIVDGKMYMNEDKGILSCVDPSTGEPFWKQRVGGTYAASPIFADGKLYFFSGEGKIHVLKPGDKFDLVSESSLGDGFNASPAVSGNRLVLRSISKLYCLEE
ncbi:outer membrane protein assembly factor BamB family protein [Mariniblastus fucicola]|uniref:Outer membrane biogenesis protein BamB n=1 Tax=Mariniblastus fucicola TaxID=980251 RepID=A0A5B9PEB2_9BACT|nr:PQQ-binding-like beta-propeller repeat protein [Mariniblastus fucicola]QEG23839.1 outer membrane biogenesis protein BamB [Mariniblastus fucicola]